MVGRSSSQQQLLESLTALTIAQGLSQLVDEESQHLKKCINRWHISLEKIGKSSRSWE